MCTFSFNEEKRENNYLQLISFVTCIYFYYPNVRLMERVIPTMLPVR